MSASGPAELKALGFLTAVEDEEHGVFGGYLVLNALGRPLEFHCTTPIKPSRAQRILYGPTLGPYLYGEQIGQTLVKKASLEPQVLCTDVPAMLATRPLVTGPMALVRAAGDASGVRVDPPHLSPPTPRSFELHGHRLTVSANYPGDEAIVAQRLSLLGEHFDLSEPFGRIREAIEEARKSGG